MTTHAMCANCGLCCLGLAVPPFDDIDGDWEKQIPSELVAEIEATAEYRIANRFPCLWFDEATKLCKHYELRPDACDRFYPGNVFCVEILDYHKQEERKTK